MVKNYLKNESVLETYFCFLLLCNMYYPLTALFYISYCYGPDSNLIHIPSAIQSRLNLTFCYRVLQKCVALETLQLGGNTELSSVSLRRLLQYQPPLRSIDLSGCTNIATYLGDASPQLWMAQRKGHKKLESLILNSQDFGKEGMEALWRESWGARARVHRALRGLLCLSLRE